MRTRKDRRRRVFAVRSEYSFEGCAVGYSEPAFRMFFIEATHFTGGISVPAELNNKAYLNVKHSSASLNSTANVDEVRVCWGLIISPETHSLVARSYGLLSQHYYDPIRKRRREGAETARARRQCTTQEMYFATAASSIPFRFITVTDIQRRNCL